jgi:hypothetical protein
MRAWVLVALIMPPALQPASHHPGMLAWLFRQHYMLVVGVLLLVEYAPWPPTHYDLRILLNIAALIAFGLVLAARAHKSN